MAEIKWLFSNLADKLQLSSSIGFFSSSNQLCEVFFLQRSPSFEAAEETVRGDRVAKLPNCPKSWKMSWTQFRLQKWITNAGTQKRSNYFMPPSSWFCGSSILGVTKTIGRRTIDKLQPVAKKNHGRYVVSNSETDNRNKRISVSICKYIRIYKKTYLFLFPDDKK